MIGHSYEIEIKSLLGGKDKAEELKRKMKAADPKFVEIGSHKQLNHYFIGGDFHQLYQNCRDIVQKDQLMKFQELVDKAKDFSVRTRWAEGKAAPRTLRHSAQGAAGASATGTGVILVIKASVDDTTSSNGTARLEWESKVGLSIEELDALVLKSGFQYQAKWSRERQEFKYKGTNVSIDKNAGYGYLSEFEMVIADKNKADETKALLRGMMRELGIDELPQDRLARMFDFYNKNWQDYYGTEKIFNIE
jgi:adenylate cyclase class IV